MQVTIKGKNLDVTDSLREYVEKRVNKLDRFLPNIEEAWMDLGVQNAKSAADRNVAQLTLKSTSGFYLRAEERSGDIRTSIDTVLDKMSRQIQRYKGKHWQSQNREADDSVQPVEEVEPEGQIVRTKRFQTRPMSVEDAIEQMELLGHDFFAFYDVATEGFSVVYRRNDGGYGLLVPELA